MSPSNPYKDRFNSIRIGYITTTYEPFFTFFVG